MAAELVSSPRRSRIDRERDGVERRSDRRRRLAATLVSGVLHSLVILMLIGFWPHQDTVESPPITVRLVPGNGAAGTAGGTGGGAATAGPQSEAGGAPESSTATDARDKAPASETAEATPTPVEPEPAPAAPTPPTAAPAAESTPLPL